MTSMIERVAADAKMRTSVQRSFRSMKPPVRERFAMDWDLLARDGQRVRDEILGDDWSMWLMLAGRGYGKTRAGAEWVHHVADRYGDSAQIALVGANWHDARTVMVEGVSGILAAARLDFTPEWRASSGTLIWPNGAQAQLFSAETPDALRGPEHGFAWCDEIAKWGRATDCWNNLIMGLRQGERPQVLATTTPRPTPLVKRLAVEADRQTRGRTADNPLLSSRFVARVTADYGGTRLGRQELDGELIAEVEGAVWSREVLEGVRSIAEAPSPRSAPAESRSPGERGVDFRRVVIGVDPPDSSTGDACGIVAVGLGADGVATVIEDASVERPAPEIWAAAVAACARQWGADRIVAEANNGGAMVASVLRAADAGLPVTLVHASHGKLTRAEPVRLLYDRGLVRHAGVFPRLEDEMCGMIAGSGYAGPGRSPDRADALVWALSELMLKPPRPVPRVRVV
jgi:phage terminase large subunit-like protein